MTTMVELAPFILTFRIALVTTLILLVAGIPLAYWLSIARFRYAFIPEALLSLPLVLPPSVLGFYLLLAFSPSGGTGQFLERYLDLRLVFTFEGLIIASIIYSTPFMIQPLLAGFRSVPSSLSEASYTLGKGRVATLFYVLLPNIRGSVLTAAILTFAHTVGEFGVVLMVGGNIPGETRVLSIAIYDAVEAMDFSTANTYAAILLVFSFLLLILVYALNYYQKRARHHD